MLDLAASAVTLPIPWRRSQHQTAPDAGDGLERAGTRKALILWYDAQHDSKGLAA